VRAIASANLLQGLLCTPNSLGGQDERPESTVRTGDAPKSGAGLSPGNGKRVARQFMWLRAFALAVEGTASPDGIGLRIEAHHG
jgi:hypothetical protein